MGLGYIIGCLLSILAWNFDRQKIFSFVHKRILKTGISKFFIQLIYLTFIALIYLCLTYVKSGEIYNCITAFLVLDISTTEMKNLHHNEKVRFYDSISTISRAVVCGFIAPLFYMLLFGNKVGILYMLIFNIFLIEENFQIFRIAFIVLSIIPSLITELFLYIIYLFRNQKMSIDFKGDFLVNCAVRPLLNVDILGAYVESVNFYFHYSSRNTDYIKSYGEYSGKINNKCIKDYLSIGYGICLIIFTIFFILIR